MDSLKDLINTNKSIDVDKAVKKDAERVQVAVAPRVDRPHDMPVSQISDDIQLIIKQWMEDNAVQSMRKTSGTIWSACCQYIGTTYVKPSRWLRDIDKRVMAGAMLTDCQSLIPERVAALWDVYAYYCGLYDKMTYISVFARFCGVSLTYLQEFGQWLTSVGFGMREKLRAGEEESIRIYAGRDTVGRLADLNHNYNWNEPRQAAQIDDNAQDITAIPSAASFAALPKKD